MQAVKIGDVVRVRGARWRVTDVHVPDPDHQILSLAGAGATNAGRTRRVITPFDDVHAPTRAERLRLVTMRRWRRAMRALLDDAHRHRSYGALRTAAAARIDLLPHQLEPALVLLGGAAARVLIADEVGLGKTIQSALIVSELRARHAADRVLVLAPAGLRTQWARELATRFSIDAVVMDAHEGRRRAAVLPVGVNPWATVQIAISSIDYVKRPEVLAAVSAVRWDAVVIDEAHGATRGSERHRAAHAICARASYVVLVTATPHNGDASAFRSLCDLGRVDGDPLLVFRRMRRDVAVGAGRRVHRLRIEPSGAERAMFDALAALSRAAAAGGAGDADATLALSVLGKRGLSSAHSLARSAARRLAAMGDTVDAVCQLPLPLEADDEGLDAADHDPLLLAPILADRTAERRLLADLLRAAEAAVPHQRKVAALERLLRRLTRIGERAIVFTEYRDTLEHLLERLHAPAVLVHGGMTPEERDASVAAFTRGSVSLLLATDAAGEGLNLHGTCRVVINLELPWNPMRLEQRIGRVDRIGQTRCVHVFHLIARGTSEAEVLLRLQNRLSAAGADIPVADPLGLALSEPEVQTSVATTRLVEQARDEFARLCVERRIRERPRRNRSLRDPALSPATSSVFAARVDRRHTRIALGGRPLAVMRTALVDAAGELSAVRVIGMSLPGDGRFGPYSRSNVAAWARWLRKCVTDVDRDGVAAWRTLAESAHREFWARRIVRERAVAAAGHAAAPAQRGLFDRRVDRRLEDESAEARVLEHDTQQRIEIARRAMLLETEPARLALLLLP